MKMYFSPLALACSLASRIALYDAALEADYVHVDLKTKRLLDGTDFCAINPLGKVPVLATDDGALLFENAGGGCGRIGSSALGAGHAREARAIPRSARRHLAVHRRPAGEGLAD